MIPKNSAKSFTIVADFNTNTTGTISLSITDENQITARDVETNTTLAGGDITGANSVSYSFVASAVLDVTSNSGTRPSSIVTPSSTPVDVFTFDLESDFDNVSITDMYFQNVAGGNAVDMANDIASATLTIGGRTIEGAAVSSDVLYFSIGTTNPVTLMRDQLTSASVNLAFTTNNDRDPANIELIIGNA